MAEKAQQNGGRAVRGDTSWRWAGGLLALLGLLPHVRLPDGLLLNLTGAKMLASALSPLLGVLGGVLTGLGWRKGDRLAGTLALLGGALAGAHVARLTARHTAFEQGLGADWRERIPPDTQRRWLPRSYTPPRLSPAEVPWERDVPFATHTETGAPLLADVWRPPADVQPSGLGVIYLHNSGWHYLGKDMLTRPWFRYLARQGHVVMDVAYSLAPRNTGNSGYTPLQAMQADVKRAIVWLKANAGRYAVDPGRIVLMGASAGGHLALLAAYTPQVVEFRLPEQPEADTSVCGVISLYGISDLEAAHRYFQRIPTADERAGKLLLSLGVIPLDGQVVGPPQFVPSILGGMPPAAVLQAHPGSPRNQVGPHCPPTLLIHGSHDFGVEVTQSRMLYRELRAAGVPAVYVELAEADHAFDLFFMEYAPAFQAAVYDVERFLAWLR